MSFKQLNYLVYFTLEKSNQDSVFGDPFKKGNQEHSQPVMDPKKYILIGNKVRT